MLFARYWQLRGYEGFIRRMEQLSGALDRFLRSTFCSMSTSRSGQLVIAPRSGSLSHCFVVVLLGHSQVGLPTHSTWPNYECRFLACPQPPEPSLNLHTGTCYMESGL
jgi:hypothetical protein